MSAFMKARLRGIEAGEVCGTTWGEFDHDAGIWTIPGER
ncbi:hypothetical protein SAMN05192542_11342 [Paraburkholderia caballeronis]|uniref:Uncharacterized protein n=1 Tax=Paraburkholderia caballeronis TaxID=416943 RepID=A0A1H7SW92_9BURK|nr:hypothetical protein C7403_105342 [Paraburkholderia caballeronis]PXX01266.1 hypothetical protein C7407_105341 [Paraburkholderia caballeronis]RAJ99381.1 hypothetical protein C7409_105110 [Paraburkholderia caballeronis]SEL76194.1 hypothetical protein SAMN05192542_11342 [Paraburkholderia caballeronis]